MRSIPISIATHCTLVVGWTMSLAAQQGPCAQITAACKNAGFVQGGGGAGTGLQGDCVIPLMQGIAQPAAARIPLPQVDPHVVEACKASHPDFGQDRATPSAAQVQPSPAGSARQVATPASPAPTIGSGVTNGNEIAPSTSGLTAGAGSLKPGIPSGPGRQSAQLEDAKKSHGSSQMSCQIGQMNQVGILNTMTLVNFAQSNGPTASGVNPGQCAFEDRAAEASYLCFATPTPYTAIFQGTTVLGQIYYGDNPGAGAVLNAAANGPTKLMNFTVHSGTMGSIPCWIVDKFGP
jgi:hypothetical protein